MNPNFYRNPSHDPLVTKTDVNGNVRLYIGNSVSRFVLIIDISNDHSQVDFKCPKSKLKWKMVENNDETWLKYPPSHSTQCSSLFPLLNIDSGSLVSH